MPKTDNTVLIEDAQIIFRNFTGKETQYNRTGDRNFGVKLDPESAAAMLEDGWNVKMLKPYEDDEDGVEQAWMPVSVGYGGGRPPQITIITSRGKTNLDESQVEMLDWADITYIDMIVRPYAWEMNGKSGIKAYLKSIYVTIEEDALERKYGALDEGTHADGDVLDDR